MWSVRTEALGTLGTLVATCFSSSLFQTNTHTVGEPHGTSDAADPHAPAAAARLAGGRRNHGAAGPARHDWRNCGRDRTGPVSARHHQAKSGIEDPLRSWRVSSGHARRHGD